MPRPLLLLSNDDGVHATGLRALAERLSDLGDLLVVAPDRERSGSGHAFTLDKPLRCDEIEPGWFSVSGSPADCVYIGLVKLCATRPALVVSGINHGFNLGSDVFYSGTVACSVEAALRQVPAIAVSREWERGLGREPARFKAAADFAHALARAALTEGLPPGTMLNVNVPATAQSGAGQRFRWAKLGRRIYRDQVDERKDLRGRRYFWIGGPPEGYGDVPGSDCAAVQQGMVAVTPLDLNLTHTNLLELLPSWHVEGFEAVVSKDLEKKK